MWLGLVAWAGAGCITKAPLHKPDGGQDLIWPTTDVRGDDGTISSGDGKPELHSDGGAPETDTVPIDVPADVAAVELDGGPNVDGGQDVAEIPDVPGLDGELPGNDGGPDAEGGCIPDCLGKSCGGDGCGGSCGACQDGCSCVNGSCSCIPTCGDGQCNGTETCDSCALDCGCSVPDEVCDLGTCIPCGTFCGNYGKSCGTFATCECGGCGCGQVCSAGQCIFNACNGKVCGDDGCGGSCGTCPAGLTCFGGACKECEDGNAVDWDGCNNGKIVEFRVNKVTGGSQRRASVAVLSGGSFVIAWESDGTGCDSFDVVAQMFSPQGGKTGSEIKINQKTTLTQQLPRLAALDNDRFVAVWESELAGGADSFDIAGRILDSGAAPVIDEIKVNTVAAQYQGNPLAVAFGEGDGFIVVWDSDGQDGSVAGVYARRFSESGVPVEVKEFQANTYTSGWQGRPAAATCLDGSTQIFWESDGQDGSSYGVYGQAVLGTGSFYQSEFKVNTTSAGDQSGPAAAGIDICGTLVAWASTSADGNSWAVASQLLTAGGVKSGPEVLVSPYSQVSVGSVAAAYQLTGGFVVAYQRCAVTAPEGEACNVHLQRLDGTGMKTGAELKVNQYTTFHQRIPAVATFEDGSFIVVWESVDQDGSKEGIYAQRFTKDGARIYH